MERMRAKNPIDAMVRLQKMMWKQFYAKEGFLFATKQLAIACRGMEELVKKSQSKGAEIASIKKD